MTLLVLLVIRQVEYPFSGACTIAFNIGANTVVIINGGETQILISKFVFFSDHFFIADN